MGLLARRRSSVNFLPTSLGAKLKLWLDASDSSTITKSSNLVSEWRDKSGNDNDFTTATSNPIKVSSNDFMEFGGTSSLKITDLTDFISDTEGEIIVACTYTKGSANSIFFSLEETSGDGLFTFDIGRSGSGVFPDDYRLLRRTTGGTLSAVGASDTSLTEVVLNLASNGTSYEIFEDNVSLTVSERTAGDDDGHWFSDFSTNIDEIRIGARDNATTEDVNIYQIIYCNEKLTTSERTELYDWLQTKF